MKMKRSFLAFTLSFLFPGAGLVYLGKWKWGVLNFLMVVFIAFLLGLLLPESFLEKYMSPISAGLAGGSGGIAMALAKQINSKLQT